MSKKIIIVLALTLMVFTVGCSSKKDIQEDPVDIPQATTDQPDEEIPAGDAIQPDEEVPASDAVDPSLGIVAEGADEAKQIDIAAINNIQLFDLDGKAIEKAFSEDEIASIGKSYNESIIDDISYVQMISGYTMEITLANDQIIHITSYGDENHIVATTNDITYHLICPEIGKILLTEIE